MYNLKRITLLGISGISLLIGSCTKTSSTSTDTSGNWVKRSDFEGVTRSEAVSFVIGDTAYIGTGYDGTNRLGDLWAYDQVNNFWHQEAHMPGTGRSSAIAFTAAGSGYIATGYDGLNMLQDVWQYSPANNSWSKKNDFAGGARYDAVGFSISDKGYVSTGYDGNYLKDLWQYDPASDLWAQQITLGGSKRSAAVAFVYNNKAYVCTGSNNGSTTGVNDLWVYDPTATPVWTEKRKISNVSTDAYDDAYAIIRNNAVAFVMNGKGYITTGENGAVLNDTWEYDFTNDLWVKKTAFEGVARTGATAFSIKDRGYVLTGRSSSTPFDDIREFLPLDAYNAND
jgi:N-acetylneuraminic acid mutarotase